MRRKSSTGKAGDEQAARDKCLRLLALRPRSVAELRRRLRDAGFEEAVTEAVLSDLQRVKLVDDEDFARSWVASRQASGGASRRKLEWELRRKGVSQALIRRLVAELVDEETEVRQAMEFAQRRLRGKPAERETLTRLRRLLLGRGFGFDTVESVLRRVLTQEEQ